MISRMIGKLLGAMYDSYVKGTPQKTPDDNDDHKPKTPWQKFWDSSAGFLLIGLGLSIYGYISLVTTTHYRGAGKTFVLIIIGIVMALIGLVRMVVQSVRKKPAPPAPPKKTAKRYPNRYSK